MTRRFLALLLAWVFLSLPVAADQVTTSGGLVPLAKMSNLAANSIIGNNTGSPATPLALTTAQVKSLLAIANTDVSGLGTASTVNTGTVPATIPILSGANDTLSGGSIGIGNGALATQAASAAYFNTAFGYHTLNGSMTTAALNNAAFGAQALSKDTTGPENSAFGSGSLFNNTTGGYNTAIGEWALIGNTLGNYSTAVGWHAGAAVVGGNDVSLTAVGYSALVANTTGQYNTAVGVQALNANVTSSFNVAIGYDALLVSTAGSNTAVGDQAMQSNTTGDKNVAVGLFAGYNASPLLQTISNSTFIGYQANSSANGITNAMALGNGAQVAASNTVAIGNTSVTAQTLNGAVKATLTIQTAQVYSAAGTALPTCNGAAEGTRASVSDATAPTFLLAYTSGGTVHSSVYCDGTSWKTE